MNNPNKLWAECTKEEHRELRNWEARYKRMLVSYRIDLEALQEQYESRKITANEFVSSVLELSKKKNAKLDLLEKQLNEIERKYDD